MLGTYPINIIRFLHPKDRDTGNGGGLSGVRGYLGSYHGSMKGRESSACICWKTGQYEVDFGVAFRPLDGH